MSKTYALEVNKTDLPLLKFLQEGHHTTPPKGKYYLVFTIDEDGKEINSILLTKRQMFERYDMAKRTPFLIALKEL
jgi:hypothetical protein